MRRFDRDEEAAKLAQIGGLVKHGHTVARACREIGITLSSYYRWKRARQTSDAGHDPRLKNLEVENAQLRKLVADLSLEAALLRDRVKRNDP